MEVQRSVGEHHALRRARASAGVEQLRRRGFIVGEDARAMGMPLGQQLFVGIAQLYKFSDGGAGSVELFDYRLEVSLVEENARFGVVEDGDQLRRGEAYIQRHDHPARLHYAVVPFKERMFIEA